jgi:hypothetical protein
MTWIKFATWLCGLYIIYYLGIILWDLMKNRLPPSKSGSHELTFSEDIAPLTTIAEYQPEAGDPVISSGGVSLRQLFNLAREEAIEYIRPVSF